MASVDVLFSDEELRLLRRLDEDWFRSAITIPEQEMHCQRDMKVRGRRLTRYYKAIGKIEEVLGMVA